MTEETKYSLLPLDTTTTNLPSMSELDSTTELGRANMLGVAHSLGLAKTHLIHNAVLVQLAANGTLDDWAIACMELMNIDVNRQASKMPATGVTLPRAGSEERTAVLEPLKMVAKRLWTLYKVEQCNGEFDDNEFNAFQSVLERLPSRWTADHIRSMKRGDAGDLFDEQEEKQKAEKAERERKKAEKKEEARLKALKDADGDQQDGDQQDGDQQDGDQQDGDQQDGDQQDGDQQDGKPQGATAQVAATAPRRDHASKLPTSDLPEDWQTLIRDASKNKKCNEIADYMLESDEAGGDFPVGAVLLYVLKRRGGYDSFCEGLKSASTK